MPQIVQSFVPGLPKTFYMNGYCGYIGVCAHSTGNDKNESAYNEREWTVKNWSNAFGHIFCDSEVTLQIADINYKAYGAGKYSNKLHVHIELCHQQTQEKFDKAYANWIYAMAYVLFKKNLPVVDGRTLVSHAWVSKNLGGTDHVDPDPYLNKWGKTWADVVADTHKAWCKLKAPVVPKITVDKACEFICTKIKSPDAGYWKHQAKSVQYLDSMVLKIATKWMEVDVENPVTKLPKKIDMDVDTALNFIDSQVNLSDPAGWRRKAEAVQYLDLLFIKIAYTWMRDIIDDAET